jgi:hypothetical protein
VYEGGKEMMITKQRAKFHSRSRTRSLGVKGSCFSTTIGILDHLLPLTPKLLVLL